MIDEKLRAAIIETPSRMFWFFREGSEGALAGHAYFMPAPGAVTIFHFVHSPRTTPAMLTLMAEWEAAHASSMTRIGHARSELERLRSLTTWRPPGDSSWRLAGDAGSWEQLLRGASVRHLQMAGPTAQDALDDFPIAFLRAPVEGLVRAGVGPVTWPEHLNASAVCPQFHFARTDRSVAVTACRYGSMAAGSGQDRTAAVWLSHDDGATFEELPWALSFLARLTPSGACSFPPEQIDAISLELVGEVLCPVIEWEDPWIAFEPGREWTASYDPEKRRWTMTEQSAL